MELKIENKVFTKKEKLVSRKIGTEYILVPVVNNVVDMNRVFTLNEVGSFIWDQIDGKKCTSEIIDSVYKEFEVDEITAKNDVMAFLKKTEKVITI